MFKLKRFLLLALFFVISPPAFSESNAALYRYWLPSDIVMKYKLRGKLKHIFSAQDFAISAEGKMYIVAEKGQLFVYDEAESLWQSVDQIKGRLAGTLKAGLVGRINKKIVSLDPQKLDRITGYATRIAISPDNQLWVVTRDHTIYRRQNDHWLRMPGLASDIDIGKDGSIWALGPDLSGTEQLAHSPQTKPIAGKNIRDMSRWNGRSWQSIALNRQVLNKRIHGFSVSAAGTPWIIQDFHNGKNARYGQRVLAWDGEQWQDKSPPGTQDTLILSSDDEGVIWVCTSQVDNSKLQNRPVNSLMFWRDKQWHLQHHTNRCVDGSFQVYQQQVWIGPQLTLTDESRSSLQDGWVFTPMRHQTLTGMDANGALWFENGRNDLKRRWHGGNNWILGKPTSLLERASSYSTLLFSQSINQHSFRVVNTAPKPRSSLRKRPIRLQVVDLNAKPELILNGFFSHIASLAIDGDGVPWVQGNLEGAPNSYIFRYSGGHWQSMPVNIPQSPTRLMSGRDGAISIGGRTQAGKAIVATWNGEEWQLTELPSLIGRFQVAFTDSRGKVWAQDSTNIYYQQGATTWHKENSLAPVPVPLKKSKKSTLKPKKKESVNLNEPKKRPTQAVKKDIKKDTPKPKTIVRQEKEKQPPEKQNPPKERVTHSLVGCWKWANGAYVVIDDGGSALIKNMPPGKWQVDLSDISKYIITWPPIVDTLTLSQDGASFSGKNQYGALVTGKRVAGNTQSLIGSWTRESGLLQKIENNGTISAAQFKGTWKALSAGNFEFLWPLVDNISFAGKNKLNAKNQFGSVTATRDQSCSLR